MSIFRNQIAAGLKQIRKLAGVPVTYRVGPQSISIACALQLGSEPIESVDGSIVTDWTEQTWGIGAEDLVINGDRVEPADGHLVIFTENGVTSTFTVRPRNGGQCFNQTGNGGSQYEIFTKLTRTS